MVKIANIYCDRPLSPQDSLVSITIYYILGNFINQLVKSNQTSSFKTVQWDATNSLGKLVSAGIYVYNIKTGNYEHSKKKILLE